MSVNWQALEEAAFQGALQDFKEFAQNHGDEEFYGVIFWCQTIEIFTYMPTEALLREEATQIHECNYSQNVGKTVEDIMEEGRWATTKYCLSDHISWDAYEEQISAVTEEDELAEGFEDQYFELLCRVALRIEASGALDAFQRTPDFRVFCKSSDHDDETCEQIFARVRESRSGR